MKKDTNEELQSRRDFFKKAASRALPILGAALLASTPFAARATEMATGCSDDGCSYSCRTSCQNECKGHCRYACKTTCSGTCSGSSKR